MWSKGMDVEQWVRKNWSSGVCERVDEEQGHLGSVKALLLSADLIISKKGVDRLFGAPVNCRSLEIAVNYVSLLTLIIRSVHIHGASCLGNWSVV